MGHLSLRFLGHPEVYHAGQPVKFPTRKTLALLIYLATTGEMHAREILTVLFWPESSPEHGRAALRNTLTYLRHALDDRIAPHLLIERDALGFDFSSDFELDLNQLAAAVQTSQPDLMATVPLQAALQQYRGDFLAGFAVDDAPEFDHWASGQREFWHQQMGWVGDRLSTLQTAAGDTADALATLTRWLELDALNEPVYQRLMQLHLASGDREAARRVYQACWAMLASEFGAEPAPETMALAQQLSMPLPRLGPSLPTAPRYLETPLVGRSAEYLKLVELGHRVRRAGMHLVSLEGEAGIGKTRLATEFLHWATTEGFDVIGGRAFETGGRLPYQPIAEAWRSRLERENAPDDLLADVWLAELSRLLPELRERYSDLPLPTGDEATAQTRLFEAIARLGLALAARKPLLLFIEDLHWADTASLDLLQYAGRRWTESNAPILFLFNVRTESLLLDSEVAKWLAKVNRDCPLTRLNLNPLTNENIQQLIQLLTGELASRGAEDCRARSARRGSRGELLSSTPQMGELVEFSRWLLAETGGQPFFLTETLKSLLERGVLTLQEEAGGRVSLHLPPAKLWRNTRSLPAGVRDVIRARLAQLSPPVMAMLAAAAVLGQNFTFEGLCQVADLGESEGLAVLDELLARRLLTTGDQSMRSLPTRFETEAGSALSMLTNSAADTYSFTHDKIRDVAYTEAGDARRRVLHRRALAALEAAGAPPAELGHHALAGRQVEAIFRYSLAAGDAALKLFAISQVITQYEQARQAGIELQTRSPADVPVADWLRLHLQLGRAYELNGQMEQARAAYQTLLRESREQPQPEWVCLALNRLATLVMQTDFDLAASQEMLQEAQQVAQSSGDKAGLAETEWNLAQISVYNDADPRLTLAHGRQALALARELGLPELIARSLNVLAMGYGNLGQCAPMEHHAQEAANLYAGLGNRAMEADCLGVIANARNNSGQPLAGIAAGRQALAIAQEIENPWGQVNATIHLTEGLLEAGEYAEALALTEPAATLAQTYHPILYPYILVRLGAGQRAVLALEAACATHLAALAANQALPSQPFAEMIHAELCADYTLAGDWPAAYHHAQQALALRDYQLFYLGLTRYYETEALIRGGDADAELAYTDVRRFGLLLEDANYGNNNPRFRLAYLRRLAVLDLAPLPLSSERRGGWGERSGEKAAITHLEQALALAEQMNLPGEQWPILAKLAELYQAVEDEARMREAMRRAAEIVQALATKIDDEGLRAGFLTAEPVRRVLEKS